ncbi:unnamed protein product [Allacma fusca]|uniref:Uncharacterized protein n=1 Tax=Allacma fusca TaxID=39272 RepID=A0A8J2PXH5_9HEXA|nr:unnamed protein product [Allacma fusca]
MSTELGSQQTLLLAPHSWRSFQVNVLKNKAANCQGIIGNFELKDDCHRSVSVKGNSGVVGNDPESRVRCLIRRACRRIVKEQEDQSSRTKSETGEKRTARFRPEREEEAGSCRTGGKAFLATTLYYGLDATVKPGFLRCSQNIWVSPGQRAVGAYLIFGWLGNIYGICQGENWRKLRGRAETVGEIGGSILCTTGNCNGSLKSVLSSRQAKESDCSFNFYNLHHKLRSIHPIARWRGRSFVSL